MLASRPVMEVLKISRYDELAACQYAYQCINIVIPGFIQSSNVWASEAPSVISNRAPGIVELGVPIRYLLSSCILSLVQRN